MEEDDPRCAAPPPAHPVQVHPHCHHAEDGTVAVAERVDGDDALEKAIKNSVLYANRLNTMCGQCRSAKCGKCRSTMAHKRKHQRTTTRRRRPTKRRRDQVGGVGPALPIGIFKTGYAVTKAIGERQQERAEKIAEKRRREVEQGKRKRYAGESFNCSIV